MAHYKPGEMDIIEKDGHFLHMTYKMEKAFEILEKNKDKIMAALAEQQARRENQTEEK